MVANQKQRKWAQFLLEEKEWLANYISTPTNIKRVELVYRVASYDISTQQIMNLLREYWSTDTEIQKVYGKWLVTQLS